MRTRISSICLVSQIEMDLVDVIKGCTTIEEIEVLEWFFTFEERHREAALWQSIIIWLSDVERDYENERRGYYALL